MQKASSGFPEGSGTKLKVWILPTKMGPKRQRLLKGSLIICHRVLTLVLISSSPPVWSLCGDSSSSSAAPSPPPRERASGPRGKALWVMRGHDASRLRSQAPTVWPRVRVAAQRPESWLPSRLKMSRGPAPGQAEWRAPPPPALAQKSGDRSVHAPGPPREQTPIWDRSARRPAGRRQTLTRPVSRPRRTRDAGLGGRQTAALGGGSPRRPRHEGRGGGSPGSCSDKSRPGE